MKKSFLSTQNKVDKDEKISLINKLEVRLSNLPSKSNMSIKVKQAIENSLKSIEQKIFDENTIRTLLISTREYIKVDSLFKELAHFIAHPSRNQGIFHKKINARYTKLKLVEEQVLKYDLDFMQENVKTKEELSDFMLSGVDVDKIDSKLFKILYEDGLEDLPEEHLFKYTGFTKLQAQKLFKDHYTKIENFYYLNASRTENFIALLRQLPPDDESQKIIDSGTELISKIRNSVDSIQKVIRGAIHFRSVFKTEDLIDEFHTYFSEVLNHFQIDQKYLQSMTNNINDILLCLMTLLHDSKFIFYDKNESRVSLNTYFEDRELMREHPNLSNSELLYEFGVLALYLKYKNIDNKEWSIPFFVSNLKLKDYINASAFFSNSINDSLKEIPWITAERQGKQIQLT